MSFWCERFEVKFDVVYQLRVHDVFFNNLNRMFSQLDCIFVSGSCQMFLTTFSMFLEFDEKMRMNKDVCGTTW